MYWSLIIYAGIITFVTRFSMIFLLKKDILNNKAKKILSFVPAAIFPAIIFPPIFLDNDGSIDLENNPKILAAILAIIVGFFSKNIIATIFTGLISYWILIFFFFNKI
jgi:branched-subunit amino acid transport protein